MGIDPFATLVKAVRLLDGLGLTYVIGGSLSSSYYGVPRATNDIDVVLDLAPKDVAAFVTAAEAEFHVDSEAAAEAVRLRRSFNIIDRETFDKVDVFVVADEPWSRRQIDRLVVVALPQPEGDPLLVPLPTPEDVVLAKLRWYEMGNRVSEIQWRDVLGVIRIQSDALDWAYLEEASAELGLRPQLEAARHKAEAT